MLYGKKKKKKEVDFMYGSTKQVQNVDRLKIMEQETDIIRVH